MKTKEAVTLLKNNGFTVARSKKYHSFFCELPELEELGEWQS